MSTLCELSKKIQVFHSGFGPDYLKYQFSNPIRIIAICKETQ